jgi:integrating conjugative element protein (TIGR03765 family)
MRSVPLAATLIGALLAVASQAQIATPDIERFLPVHTERLEVGTFEPIRRSTGVSRPFFLIGTDAVSLEWLKRNRARLVALEAFGLVVEAPTVDGYRRVVEAGKGLLIRPVNAELIAEHLGLKYYPVLITAEGLFP